MLQGRTAKGKERVKTKQGDLLPKTLPGSVCAQMIRCGKSNCKCSRGELHGPYFYHFERVNGLLVKRYIKAKDVATVRAACDARRKKEREQRLDSRNSQRQLRELIRKLRDSEKLLLQALEMRNG